MTEGVADGGPLDVCGIGSAIVDILVEAELAVVSGAGLVKGTMHLMDLDASERVHAQVPGGRQRCGGSAANTIAGLACLGARTGFIGRVADDRFGQVFVDDLAELGVHFGSAGAAASPEWATGRCLILVTPDADRTMCTTLGVAAHLAPAHLDIDLIERARITYFEGYLWDEPVARSAIRRAISASHAAGGRVAMSLSDPFCVDRHRVEWRELVDHQLDVVFANESELCSLAEVDDLAEACRRIRRPGLLVTVTRGPRGAWVFGEDGPIIEVSAHEPPQVVDTTGAGDLYAAGFLYGLVRDLDPERCARLGGITAAEIISHVGARPDASLPELVEPVLRTPAGL